MIYKHRPEASFKYTFLYLGIDGINGEPGPIGPPGLIGPIGINENFINIS